MIGEFGEIVGELAYQLWVNILFVAVNVYSDFWDI